MACLRRGQAPCIRAGFSMTSFRRRPRNARHRLQVPGLGRDDPGHSYYLARCQGRSDCAGAAATPRPSPGERLGEEGQRHSGLPAILWGAASRAPPPPASPSASDVDMQPVGEAKLPSAARSPQGARRPAWRPWAWPASAAMQLAEGGRRLPSRAKGTRSPPRLRSEGDRAPRLTLSKRKLQLLLAEPVSTKRKKYVACSGVTGLGSGRVQKSPGVGAQVREQRANVVPVDAGGSVPGPFSQQGAPPTLCRLQDSPKCK
ncbi:PREDICTED: uncharacterized protein LOC105983191 [Dipodomys ordii]|uniref:Uncharacterized protein LOC105983191 n=1 Tax=Dipodomys ordii TaxID=10020 RepID=A0A1S3EYG5_DIPOR|nr:PREDICTED: uncharacterized protein LOC105983191 [Dipodomys ordii]